MLLRLVDLVRLVPALTALFAELRAKPADEGDVSYGHRMTRRLYHV
jgi:hypothetical protein